MIEYIINNWETLAGIAAAFILFFDRLSKITPTDSDNKIVAFVQKIFTVLGVRVPDIKNEK